MRGATAKFRHCQWTFELVALLYLGKVMLEALVLCLCLLGLCVLRSHPCLRICLRLRLQLCLWLRLGLRLCLRLGLRLRLRQWLRRWNLRLVSLLTRHGDALCTDRAGPNPHHDL